MAGIFANEENRVEVEYDYSLPGAGEKEIDVVVWDESELFNSIHLIECKFENTPISAGVVDEVSNQVIRSDAERGLVVSRSGFRSGAVKRAEGTGIKLITLRQIDPDTDFADDAVHSLKGTQRIFIRDIEILDMDVERLDDSPDGEIQEIYLSFDRLNSRLFTTDREFLGETLIDRVNYLKRTKSVGEHTEEFDDTVMLIRGE
ncbi:restriction endonuclease, partial [Saliphagus infecundisoli]|uniref:restriction endonuclease n=1 Tax=Saliphagus infecundisoli TaxID=1849069 RepID=UPI00296ECDFD